MEFSSGVEMTMSDQFGNNCLLESLKPILRSKIFSGRSISWSSEVHKYQYWAYTIIDLLITVITVSYSVHCTHFFFHSAINTGQILIGLILTFYYMGASLLCCINIIASFMSGREFMKQVQAYHVLSGRDAFARLEKINCRLLWVFILALLLVIILISTMFLASVFPKESVLVRMLMFSHSVDIEFSVGVVGFAVVSFFIGSGQLGDFWILAFFCQVFRQEFRHLRNKWLVSRTNSSNDTGNNWYKDIDTFRKEYEQVVRLVNAVERTFRFDLLLYFGVIIPVTCVFIYATLQPQDIAEADLVVIQIMACVTAVECCFIIFVGVKINSAVSTKISLLTLFHTF